MRIRWLRWGCTLAVIAAIAMGCASRNGSSGGGQAPAAAKREADEFKAQARQGLIDFLREKPRPPACETGYITGRQLTVLATSDWIERAGLRRGDRITSIDGVPASQLQNQARPPARVAPGAPFTVGVSRGGRELSLTLVCAVKPEVWIAARRTQEAAAQGDWEACQAAAVDYIFAVGFMESLALEFHGRCGFHRAMTRGDRFNLDLARDLYDWQAFRIREKSYEPGGLDEIRDSVLGGVAILRREGFREHADNLEEQFRHAPARDPGARLARAARLAERPGPTRGADPARAGRGAQLRPRARAPLPARRSRPARRPASRRWAACRSASRPAAPCRAFSSDRARCPRRRWRLPTPLPQSGPSASAAPPCPWR